jgi:hypothetical protein
MSVPVDLVAETDDAGRVVWIWRHGPNDRHARPIADPSKHVNELGQARCYGSTPEAISEWFARHVRGR